MDLRDWTNWNPSWTWCVSWVHGDRWVVPATWNRWKMKGKQMNWKKIIIFCSLASHFCYFETITACFFIREITSNSPVAFLARAECCQGNIKGLLEKEMKTAVGWLISPTQTTPPTQTTLYSLTVQDFGIDSLTWGDCLLQMVLLMSMCVCVCVHTRTRVCLWVG